MKKTLSFSARICLLTGLFLFFVLPVFADEPTPTPAPTAEGVLEGCYITKPGAKLSDCDISPTQCLFETNPKCGVCCLLQVLYSVTDWIFAILIGLASIFIIIGAMNLLMSAGDPSKVASGRNYIMYAAIGLIVGFLAKAIPAVVKLAVGVT